MLQSLARNHGFIDGNKRTSFLIVDLFLPRSGYRMRAINDNPDHALENFILTIVQENTKHEEIAEWFRMRIAKRTG